MYSGLVEDNWMITLTVVYSGLVEVDDNSNGRVQWFRSGVEVDDNSNGRVQWFSRSG